MKQVMKILGVLLLGVATTAMPNTAHAQQNTYVPEAKIMANYGKNEKSAYASYWKNNPRLRFGYVDRNNFNVGTYIPLSRNDFKLAASKNGKREEIGLYYQRNGKIALIGAGAEYLNGKISGEVHARFDISKQNKVLVGYGNLNGTSIATAGDFFDAGKYHFSVLVSFKTKNLEIPFGGKEQVMIYFAREGVAKFFYRNDGESKSFTGFVRFGKEGSNRYTSKAFDIDRLDFAEFSLRHSKAELFDIPLQPSNTHLSDHGTCAAAPRIISTPNTSLQGVDTFCTINDRWIGGYGFSRSENKSGTEYEHMISSGTNIGPLKFVLSWGTQKGFSIHTSFRHRIE